MKDFWRKAQIYIDKNRDTAKKPANFIYNNSEIEFELLLSLLKIKDNLEYYLEAYDREFDYSRLLRQENYDLKAYIEDLEYNMDDEDKDIVVDITNNDLPS